MAMSHIGSKMLSCPMSNLRNTPCRVTYSSGSIEIDPIDASNLRRFSSRRNRIGSNRTNVTKSSVRPGFEYTFFALTLNPMGKPRCLEIEDYAGGSPAGICGKSEMFNRTNEPLHSPSVFSVSARIHCGPSVFPAKSIVLFPIYIDMSRLT